MAVVAHTLEAIVNHDFNFVGTIAFRNEEVTLPDGSKMALGIDGAHWVLIHQQPNGQRCTAYNYDHDAKKISIDQNVGGTKEVAEFKKLLGYFFAHAKTEDLVTLLPPQNQEESVPGLV